jgi:Ni/Fe-hydrogenase subunit HybB-like protein
VKRIVFSEIEGRSAGFYGLAAVLAAFLLLGLAAVAYVEHFGHYVTGSSNQVVWGIPDVFAMFLIVSASGALNVAIVSSVFSQAAYRPLERLSCLLAIGLLVGGLMILALDLGRPDRVIVAMLNRNFKSIFAWNLYLYGGFIALVSIYLWVQMERRMNRFIFAAAMAAFIWRITLTSGSGSIYGVLVAREAYSAILAPLFIAMSFSYGLAVYLLVLLAACKGSGRELGDALLRRLGRLLGIFVAVVLYLTAVQHLTNGYAAEHGGVEGFILRDGGIYPWLFWCGQVLAGGLLPLALLFWSTRGGARPTAGTVIAACTLVIAGAFCQLYVLVLGGQAWPLQLFPGMEVSSSFFDGAIASYTPSLPELALGFGGMALAGLIVLFGLKLLRLLPATLANEVTDTHPSAAASKT